MIALLSWLFKPAPEREPEEPREELRHLKKRRHSLIRSLSALRDFGFDALAEDDQAALRALERRIHALQLRLGAHGGDPLSP